MKHWVLCFLSLVIGSILPGQALFYELPVYAGESRIARGIRGDSFITQDVHLPRRLSIAENVKLPLIGEVFNVFNIANLSGYSNVLNQVNYGQPRVRAGQVFGSAGPRASQVAMRLQF